MIETTLHAPPRSTHAGRTPELDDAPLGDLDTARLRNMVAQRVFGEQLDPVRIGRYPVLRRIGQGGMGVVYAGYDNELDRRIAIKLLRRGDTRDEGEAERMRARLLREARALAQLSSPRIVQIYEVGEHDGQVFLAMEFVEGETLRQWIESRPRRVSEIVEMYCEAARGLAAAHAAGLVHRDFKPDNAIVVADVHAVARVRVLDFGIATTTRVLERDDQLRTRPATIYDVRLTATGAMLGTPAYMSPEQFEGKPTDARTDQFSLAVALFEALYGARPFPGETMQAVVEATLDGRIVVPGGKRVPSRVLQALRRALSRDPNDRFASIDALVRALELRGRRWRWAAVGAVAAVAGVAWISLRARELTDEVASAGERADDAESRLRGRERELVLGELSLSLFRDPTSGIESIAQLPDHADAWISDAWPTIASAEDLGVADRVIRLPDGWERGALLDEHTALLQGAFRSALWDLDGGEIDILTTDAGHEFDVSPGAQWVAAVVGDELRIIDVRTRVEQTWWLTGCEPAEFDSDESVLALDCPIGPPRSLAWSPPGAEQGALAIHEAPSIAFNRPLRALFWSARHPDTPRRGSQPAGSYFMYARGDAKSAGIQGSPLDAGVEPLLLWRDDYDRPTRIPVPTARAAAFSPSETTLAVGTIDGSVWLVDLSGATPRPERLAMLEAGQLDGLRFSRDAQGLCATNRDGTVVVWDVLERQEVQRITGLANASGCFWHADGSFSIFANREYRHYPRPVLARLGGEVRAVTAAGAHYRRARPRRSPAGRGRRSRPSAPRRAAILGACRVG